MGGNRWSQSFLPVFDLRGYPGRILLTHGLFVFSSWGGPVTLVGLVPRPRAGLSVVAVLPRVAFWLSAGSAVVRPLIPLVASAVW